MSFTRAFEGSLYPALFALALSASTLSREASAAPLGGEFQVNTFTAEAQFEPAVAMDVAGNFVVVWNSVGQDGATYGVFGQRFSSSGAPLGAELQINAFTLSVQRSAEVAFDSDGDFVVVWQSAQDGHVFGVFGQRFNAAGVKQGAEFQINTQTLGQQSAASIAMDADGDFVVAWASSDHQDGDDYGVFAKLFNAAGAAQGGEFLVNSQTVQRQRFPAVAMDPDGDFIVVWDDENVGDVAGQRFSASGMRVGAEFLVNSYTEQNQSAASVGVDSGGDFVVVWSSYGQDGSDRGIFGRRFNVFGVAQGPDFPVNSHAAGAQGGAQVSMESGGDFVAVWQDPALDGDGLGVFGLAFNGLAVPQGLVFQVNAFTSGGQFPGDVAMDPSGGFVVVWSSVLQDGSGAGIFGRRFASAAAAASIDIDGNGMADPLTDGLLVVRYLFGFRGATLIANAVAGDCERCTAPEIEAFIGALTP